MNNAIQKLIICPSVENAMRVKDFQAELHGMRAAINILKPNVDEKTAAELEECMELLRQI